MILIRNDGTGSEIISEKQLSNYFRCKANEMQNTSNVLNPASYRFESNKLEEMVNSKTISFITSFVRERDYLKNLSFLSGIEMPKVIESLQTVVKKPKETLQHCSNFRCLIEHPEFDGKKQEIFSKDLEKHRLWKEKQEQNGKGFGIAETRTPEEIKEEKKIRSQILNDRKTNEKIPSQENIKQKVIQEHETNKKNQEEAREKMKKLEEEAKRQKEEAAALALMKRTQFPSVPKQPKKIKKEVPPETKIAAPIVDVAKSLESDGMTGTISQISITGEFVANYFYTKKGMEVKYEPISEQKLKEWNAKRKQNMKKESKGQEKGESEEKKNEGEGEQVKEAEKHNPIVALEPEDTDAKNKLTEQGQSVQGLIAKQSHYKEMMQKMRENEQKERENAENYHISKTKDFTVLGNTRLHKPAVGVLNRPKPPAEINEQYISIDAITDRRVKTMSMANRCYFKAPPVQTIRKQGQHQMIARALNKKQTFEELMAETNSMINYSLHDPNKRNFLVKNIVLANMNRYFLLLLNLRS